ncbi:hypothetical protein [Cedecea neteri]|nr:hypothetical protein [Cedecea neteri]
MNNAEMLKCKRKKYSFGAVIFILVGLMIGIAAGGALFSLVAEGL